MSELDVIMIGATIVNVVLTIINTWWAYRRTCYGRDTLSGSKTYWGSWGEREKDLTEKVLKRMTEEQLKEELARRRRHKLARETKKKKLGRSGEGSPGTPTATPGSTTNNKG